MSWRIETEGWVNTRRSTRVFMRCLGAKKALRYAQELADALSKATSPHARDAVYVINERGTKCIFRWKRDSR